MKRAAAVVCALVALAAILWILRAPAAPAPDVVPVRAASVVASVQAQPVRPAAPAPKAAPLSPDAPRAAAPEAAKPVAPSPDQAALFAKLVGMGQGIAFAEALMRNAQQADAFVDKLCEETRKLHDHPALPDHDEHNHDAAGFMAPLVDYESPLDQPPGRLHIAEPLRGRLNAYGADWPTKIAPEDFAGLGFGWLQALAQYDHWTLLSAGRLRDLPAGTNIYGDPIPNYLSLMHWSKLRLALGFRRGDVLAASAEVRHLADLIRSQQILIAEMIAVMLYRFDARARDVAAAAGLDVSAWPAGDTAQLDRHRKMAFASMYFAYPGVSPQTLRKAVSCMPSSCSALLEAAGANRSFGAFATPDNFALVSELATEHGCEAAVLARIAASRELPAQEALQSVSEDVDQQIPKFFAR